MNCSIPYGALRYDDEGKLQYLYCGNWYYPDGTPADEGGNPPVVIPTDLDTDETTIYPCGKAHNVAYQLWKYADECWDESDNQLPVLFIRHMQNYMDLDLKNWWVDQTQSQALIMKGNIVVSYGLLSISKTDAIPEDLVENLTCRLLPAMSEGIEDDKEAIWSALIGAIDAIWPTFGVPDDLQINNWWRLIANSFGKQLLKDLASAGAYTDAECDCSGGVVNPPPVYSGLVWWDNTRTVTLEYQGATFKSANLAAINKIGITVWGAANTNYQEVQWREDFGATGTVGEVEIHIERTFALIEDYFPAENWSDTNPTEQSNYQRPFFYNVTAPDSLTYSQEHNIQKVLAKWDTPVDLSAASLENRWKINPKDQLSGGTQRWVASFTIVYAGPQR